MSPAIPIMEALGSVRCAVSNNLGSGRLTDEILQTSLCLVEQSVNALPVTPASKDPTEIETLARNHFLLGEFCIVFPSLDSFNFNRRRRYACTHAYEDEIWTRWFRDPPTVNKQKIQPPSESYELNVNDFFWIIESHGIVHYPPRSSQEMKFCNM